MKVFLRNSSLVFASPKPFKSMTINAVSSHNILNVPVCAEENKENGVLQAGKTYRFKLYKGDTQYTEPILMYDRTSAYIPNSGGGALSFYKVPSIDGVYTFIPREDSVWLSIGEATSVATREVDKLVTVNPTTFMGISTLCMAGALKVEDNENIAKSILARGKSYKMKLYKQGQLVTTTVSIGVRNSSYDPTTNSGGSIQVLSVINTDGVKEFAIPNNSEIVYINFGASYGSTHIKDVDTVELVD